MPIRSVSSVLRSRKGVLSLQLRSEGADDHGNLFGMRRARKKASEDRESRRGGRRTNDCGNTTHCNRNDNDDDNEEEDEDENNEERGRRRRRGGSLSARERSRSRNARRREMRSRSTKDDENEEDGSSSKRNVDKMMLSFEYHIEIPNKYDTTTTTTTGGYPNNNNNNSGGGRYSIVHRVGVTDANGISLSTSIARQRTRSEIVSHPRLFLRLLDPLRRTAEVALTIDDTLKVVTATSFHPNELGGSGGSNTILQANAARNAVLKTETSTGAEEFDEYDFRSNRGKKMKKKAKQVSPNEGGSDNDDDDGCDNEGDDAPPLDVNQKVILVFSIKEAKAMLQYCAQTYNSSSYHDDDDDGVVLSFHWGGRPIVIETAGDYFTAELVLATLHHGMIASNIAGGGGGGGE